MVVYMAIYMVVYMVMDTYMIYIYRQYLFFCIYIQYIDINFKHSKKKNSIPTTSAHWLR